MNFNMLRAIFFALLCDVGLETHAEVYASTTDIEYLLDTRKKVIDELNSYINKEDRRLYTLKMYLNLYKREHGKAMKDITNYIGSPISAFILIKSLTIDFVHVKKNVKLGAENINNVTLKNKNFTYPNKDDLKNTARAISNLIKVYNLDKTELVEGKLNGAISSSPMSASDCYELGRELYNIHDYASGRTFMEEAYRKYNKEKITYHFTDIDIIEHVGYGSYLMGDVRTGMKWIHKILRVHPNHERAVLAKKIFQDKMGEAENKLNEDSNNIYNNIVPEADNVNNKQDTKTDDNVTNVNQNYEALCRGDMEVPVEISSRLTCSYFTVNHPFLKIAPLRMELKYFNPDIVLFHNVLYDKEIEKLKQLAKPRLQSAKVVDEKSGIQYGKKGLRISKTAMLNDMESDVLQRLSHRFMHITGLNMNYNRVVEVADYGIGGYFEPHNDYTNVDGNAYFQQGGERIASLLFYMTDVALGGATVFPHLGVRVPPVKGDALFYFNLHLSGKGNIAVQHAGCPVLHGTKWLLIKSIYQAGQELLKPCNLEYQKEGFGYDVPRPVLKSTREATLDEDYEEELLEGEDT